MDTSSKKLIVEAPMLNMELERARREVRPTTFGGQRWFVVSAEKGNGTKISYFGIECYDDLLDDWA